MSDTNNSVKPDAAFRLRENAGDDLSRVGAAMAAGPPACPEFEVYSLGIVCASVCSSLSPEETERRLNEERPTGIESQWKLSTDATFRGGAPNPSPCERRPETHKHYLFNC